MSRFLLAIVFFMMGSMQVSLAEDLNIDAGNGIAWFPEQKHYHATGRVRIVRGTATTWSDEARAYYEDDAETITRIDLLGHVRFMQGTLEIEGDFAQIIPKGEDVRVTGEMPRLQNAGTVITATDHLHYQGENKLVYALGDALLVEGVRKLSSEKMKGILFQNASGDLVLEQAYFSDNVRGDDGNVDADQRLYIEGDRGLYHAQQEWMRVCGDSRILRGEDVMQGECAHYDLIGENFQFLNEATLTSPLPVVHIPTQSETVAVPKPEPTEKRTRLILKTNS